MTQSSCRTEPSDGVNAFAGHGIQIDGLVFLSPSEAMLFLNNNAILVDLRDGDFENNGREFDVKEVIFIPHRELSTRFFDLPHDRLLILADCAGLQSRAAAKFLTANGYNMVAPLIGGMVEWSKSGMPAIVDPDGKLTGSCACRLRPNRAFRSRSGC